MAILHAIVDFQDPDGSYPIRNYVVTDTEDIRSRVQLVLDVITKKNSADEKWGIFSFELPDSYNWWAMPTLR